MSRPAYTRLVRQVIDQLNRWNSEYIVDAAGVSDATLYSWYHGHATNPQLRTVTSVAHVLGFHPKVIPRKGADRRRHFNAHA